MNHSLTADADRQRRAFSSTTAIWRFGGFGADAASAAVPLGNADESWSFTDVVFATVYFNKLNLLERVGNVVKVSTYPIKFPRRKLCECFHDA